MIRIDTLRLGQNPPDEISVVITTPSGSAPMAVEPDPVSGLLCISRLYQTAMRCPGTMGLIPQTRGEAGGLLSAFLLVDDPLPAGLILMCRPVGVVSVTGLDADIDTVLAVPLGRITPALDRVKSYTDIPAPQLRRIAHYLTHCQDLEDDQVPRSAAWGDVNEARRVIQEAAGRVRPGIPAGG